PNSDQQPWITILGVVGDVRHFGLDVDPRPEIYRPYAVNPLGSPIPVIRTASDAGVLAPALAARLRPIGPDVPARNISRPQAHVAVVVGEVPAGRVRGAGAAAGDGGGIWNGGAGGGPADARERRADGARGFAGLRFGAGIPRGRETGRDRDRDRGGRRGGAGP